MTQTRKKILVTGSEGFIGHALVNRLRQRKIETISFDIKNGQDVTNSKDLEKIAKNKFDVIFHLAGFSGSAKNDREKKLFFEINTFSSVQLFEFISKYSPKTKIVISGSRLEYGKPLYLPVDENHPTNPNSAYGLSRLLTSQMALIYHRKNNLDVTVFRTSNVYGPHSKFKFSGFNLINKFIDSAKVGGKLNIFGEGDQTRDYIYIDDMVDALMLAAESKKAGQIYNLGYGEGIKLIEMAKLIVKKAGRGTIVKTTWGQDEKIVETGDYVTNLNKITKELGFQPKVTFEQGVEMCLASA